MIKGHDYINIKVGPLELFQFNIIFFSLLIIFSTFQSPLFLIFNGRLRQIIVILVSLNMLLKIFSKKSTSFHCHFSYFLTDFSNLLFINRFLFDNYMKLIWWRYSEKRKVLKHSKKMSVECIYNQTNISSSVRTTPTKDSCVWGSKYSLSEQYHYLT